MDIISKMTHYLFRDQDWLVSCFGFNGPSKQYFSLYRAVSQREGEREEKWTDESKNVQTTPTRTYYKRSRSLPHYNPSAPALEVYPAPLHHPTTPPHPHPPEIKTAKQGIRIINLNLSLSLSLAGPRSAIGRAPDS